MKRDFDNPLWFRFQCLRRATMRLFLRRLVKWQPLNQPIDGYSVIIGARADLLGVLRANLRMLSRQDRAGLHNITVVLDRTRAAIGEPALASLRDEFPELPLEIFCYSAKQVRVAAWVNWAWVYSWMSWAIGTAAVRTRYAILQDLDAMLLRPGVLRERHEAIRVRGVEFLGDDYYAGRGVELAWRVARTYELMFDVAFVRRRFKPLDLFNVMTRVDGKPVDYDTFLWAQHQDGRKDILPIDRLDMVHPSQMICQFAELVQRRRQPLRKPNLPLIPYFYAVGGEPGLMAEQTEAMRRSADGRVPFFGTKLDLSGLDVEHCQWLSEQCRRMERSLHGEVRPEVAEYLRAIEAMVERVRGAEPVVMAEGAKA